MNKVFSFALMALFFASCQNATENETAEISSESTTETAVVPVPAEEPVTLNPVSGETTAPAAATPAAAPAAGNPQGKVALNPEHGQPNHRCDIPVGAPLNSPAGTPPPAAAAVNPAPAMAQPQPSAPATAQPASGQRLNPPHGQPGHSCDVAVGAPLNG